MYSTLDCTVEGTGGVQTRERQILVGWLRSVVNIELPRGSHVIPPLPDATPERIYQSENVLRTAILSAEQTHLS